MMLSLIGIGVMLGLFCLADWVYHTGDMDELWPKGMAVALYVGLAAASAAVLLINPRPAIPTFWCVSIVVALAFLVQSLDRITWLLFGRHIDTVVSGMRFHLH